MNPDPVFLSAFICALRVCVLTLAVFLSVSICALRVCVLIRRQRRHDTVDLQPDKTTVYRLIVIAKDGSEIRRDVRIEVEP